MSERNEKYSELVEIAKRNGEFRKNYRPFLGAYLYLRLIAAARGRSLFWSGWLAAGATAAFSWLEKHGWWPNIG